MEKNSDCREGLVSKYDGVVDENDNYSYDSDVEKSHIERQRQTTLSEYFSELPKTTPAVNVKQDEIPEKLVNVSLLLRQLLSAHVLLHRLPQKPVDIPKCRKPSVQLYCHNCKTLHLDDNLDYNQLKSRKSCSKCNTDLLFICEKCNESHYHVYKYLSRHRRNCKGVRTGKSLKDVHVLYCEECSFKTSYRKTMANHMTHTGHMVHDGRRKGVAEPAKKRIIHVQRRSDYKLKFLVEQNDIDNSVAKKRYCPTCSKVSDNQSTDDTETCKTCNTTLLYQCGKCDNRYVHNCSFMHHLKSKCYPDIYSCPECEYTGLGWRAMKNHLRKPCRRPKRDFIKEFRCEHCSLKTAYKWNLKVHLGKYHQGLFV